MQAALWFVYVKPQAYEEGYPSYPARILTSQKGRACLCKAQDFVLCTSMQGLLVSYAFKTFDLVALT